MEQQEIFRFFTELAEASTARFFAYIIPTENIFTLNYSAGNFSYFFFCERNLSMTGPAYPPSCTSARWNAKQKPGYLK